MDAERLFALANVAVLPGWLCLVLLPRWRHTQTFAGLILPGLMGILYTGLFLSNLGSVEGGFGSLAEVASLFENPWLLLVGWVHYLAFDLFVGAWEVRDAQRSGVHHLLVIPCLGLTLMAGPAGLLLYLVARTVRRRDVSLAAAQTSRG